MHVSKGAALVALLVVMFLAAPAYVIVYHTCAEDSMQSCDLSSVAQKAGALCVEGNSGRFTLHGKRCTLRCIDGDKVPSVNSIVCKNGIAEGMGEDGIQCLTATVDVSPRSSGADALCGGTHCEADPGSSAVLHRIQNASSDECSALFKACRVKNSAFSWSQHDPPNGKSAMYHGVCTLGCFVSLPPQARTVPATTVAPIASVTGAPASSKAICDTDEAHACLHVQGSCDTESGDYYKRASCRDGAPEWLHEDGIHRLRYDGNPWTNQGGKWLLQKSTHADVIELARQGSFDVTPRLGTEAWQCMRRQNVSMFEDPLISHHRVMLTLGVCTCTDSTHCSGHGTAVGSKELGPNCICQCDLGYGGEQCETPICIAPGVLNAQTPPCAEGAVLYPNQICTPMCDDGFVPTAPEFVCELDDGIAKLRPKTLDDSRGDIFECLRQNRIARTPQSNEEGVYFDANTISVRACAEIDCSFGGIPTGDLRDDGSCVCDCTDGYSGPQCRNWPGVCFAPGGIDNAAPTSCEEGLTINSVCTTQCEDGYHPIPARLECTAKVLSPPSFQCFGGPSPVEKHWCITWYTLITVFAVVAFPLIAYAFEKFGRATGRIIESKIVADQLSEVCKDQDGAFHRVVRIEGDPFPNAVPSGEPTPAKDRKEGVESIQHELHGETTSKHKPEDIKVVRSAGHVVLQADAASCATTNLHEDASVRSSVLIEADPDSHGYPEAETPNTKDDFWLVKMYHLEQRQRHAQHQQEQQQQRQQQQQDQRYEIPCSPSGPKSSKQLSLELSLSDAVLVDDITTLQTLVPHAEAMLQHMKGLPAVTTGKLKRLLLNAHAILDERCARIEIDDSNRAYESRVRSGALPDWSMTFEEFCRHAEAGDVTKVRAAIRGFLHPLTRSADGQRFTALHYVCRGILSASMNAELVAGRLAVVELLLAARGHANAVDIDFQTPLDLALLDPSTTPMVSEVMCALCGFGLRTSVEAVKQARDEAKPSSDFFDPDAPEAPPAPPAQAFPSAPAMPPVPLLVEEHGFARGFSTSNKLRLEDPAAPETTLHAPNVRPATASGARESVGSHVEPTSTSVGSSCTSLEQFVSFTQRRPATAGPGRKSSKYKTRVRPFSADLGDCSPEETSLSSRPTTAASNTEFHIRGPPSRPSTAGSSLSGALYLTSFGGSHIGALPSRPSTASSLFGAVPPAAHSQSDSRLGTKGSSLPSRPGTAGQSQRSLRSSTTGGGLASTSRPVDDVGIEVYAKAREDPTHFQLAPATWPPSVTSAVTGRRLPLSLRK